MDMEKKACCARSAGWFLVGVVIALAWGIGNFTNGMALVEAFAIPGLIVFTIVGVMAVFELDVPRFGKLSLSTRSNDRKHRQHTRIFVGSR